MVLDLERKRVVWIARGLDQETLRGLLPRARAAALRRDRSHGRRYVEAVRGRNSDALSAGRVGVRSVYVVAKYGLEGVDRVRVYETNRLTKAAGPVRSARRVIKARAGCCCATRVR